MIRFRALQRLASGSGCVLLVGLLLVSCTDREKQDFQRFSPGKHEFSVMSYNLRNFNHRDRDGDGQDDDFKPEHEIAPMISLLQEIAPDILVVQEIGDSEAFLYLKERLQKAGCDYRYTDYLAVQGYFANLGILSRYPILVSDSITNLSYSIKGQAFQVSRGFQQVDFLVLNTFTCRLINVHLKSKVFHDAGQTEMRRNEARLLGAHLRRILRKDPHLNLVVCGDFNDNPGSSAMRELDYDQSGVSALPLQDLHGDTWTHYYRKEQSYSRIDYFLVSSAMSNRWVMNKSGIVRDERTYASSDHRPIISLFRVTY